MPPTGFADSVAFVWKVADKLRGTFKQHEYGSIILPCWSCAARTPSSRRHRVHGPS